MDKIFFNTSSVHFEKISDPSKSLRSDIRFISVLFIFIAIIALIIPAFFYEVVGVRQSSMLPTIKEGDKVGICKVGGFTYGDIVVIYKPAVSRSKYVIKRVMALEGDEIWLDKDQETGVYYINRIRTINGERKHEVLKDESYINGPMGHITDERFTVREGCIFVLGDNRNNSTDSFDYSIFGETPKNAVLGKVITILTKSNFGVSVGNFNFYWYDTKVISRI